MKVNLFEGFKDQMGNILNIRPKDVGEDYLDYFILPNPVINTSDGNKYKLQGNISFKVVFRGHNIVIIRDVSYSDPKYKKLADFPHGINASPDAGKEYILTKDEYNKLIQWAIPASGGEEGGPMGGMI